MAVLSNQRPVINSSEHDGVAISAAHYRSHGDMLLYMNKQWKDAFVERNLEFNLWKLQLGIEIIIFGNNTRHSSISLWY